ncbi:MAG: NADH-quinone oxidoreductase subunit NuoK [Thermoprotei archaeon]|nr:MAG: NADH-quinone oxidoreductase subunit NuoK [Thermoprotei archaeon]
MDATFFLIVSAILFAIGAFGALIHRSATRKLISLEIMFNAELLLFLSLSTIYAPLNGLIFSVFIIALTSSEVGVIIPIIVLLYRRVKTVDTTKLAEREGDIP